MLEAKFGDDSLFKSCRFKQIEGTSEIGNFNFVGSYATWLNDGIYAVTNIDVEILIYIQIFILVKTSLF